VDESRLTLMRSAVEDAIDRRGRIGKHFVSGLVISTVVPPDGIAPWETAIAIEGQHWSWHPVQRYQTREDAEAGHAEWVARAPDLDLVTDLGVEGQEPYEVRLRTAPPPSAR
jgi:hypothetical protein